MRDISSGQINATKDSGLILVAGHVQQTQSHDPFGTVAACSRTLIQ